MFHHVQQFRGRNKWLILYKGHGKRSSILTFNIKHISQKHRAQHPTRMEIQVKTENRPHVNEDR